MLIINVHGIPACYVRQSNTFNHLKFKIPTFHCLAAASEGGGKHHAGALDFFADHVIFSKMIFFKNHYFTQIMSYALKSFVWKQTFVGIGYARPRLAGALINFFLVRPLVPVLALLRWCPKIQLWPYNVVCQYIGPGPGYNLNLSNRQR